MTGFARIVRNGNAVNVELPIKERDIQKQVIAWFRLQHGSNVMVVASMNAAARNRRTGKLLKAEGMVAGDPDLKILWGAGELAHIELKRPGNKLQKSQEAFRDWLLERGFRWAKCESLEDVIRVCHGWGVA